MKDKDVIVLGTLKKEKSSKPFFVLLVFTLIIGFCFGLPYIKAYLGDDYTVDNLINKSTTTSTTATTTTNVIIEETILTCTLTNSEYIYTFTNNKLNKINHKYNYTNTEEQTDNSIISEFNNRSNKVNSIGGVSNITKIDTGFIYSTEITTTGDFNLIDPNYYNLNTEINTIKNELIQKGFDCK